MQILCDEQVADVCLQHLDQLPGAHQVRSFQREDYSEALLSKAAEEMAAREGGLVLVLPYELLKDYWPPVFLAGISIQPFPYLEPASCGRWFTVLQSQSRTPSRAVVTCMQKPFYVKWARRISDALQGLERFDQVLLKPPCETDREELTDLLAEGFRLAFYCGHGRSRGFSGYRGVRWEHLAHPSPCEPGGVFLSLTCSSLAMDKQHSNPIGIDWINSGRLATFVGFRSEVHIEPLARITRILLSEIVEARTVEDLLRRLEIGVRGTNRETIETLQGLRLVGSSQVSIG